MVFVLLTSASKTCTSGVVYNSPGYRDRYGGERSMFDRIEAQSVTFDSIVQTYLDLSKSSSIGGRGKRTAKYSIDSIC